MDKRKAVLLSVSGLLLATALLGTYALVSHWGQSRSMACSPSAVAALAEKDLKDIQVRDKILAQDKAFSAQYGQVCMAMCAARTQLASRLGKVTSADPEALALLGQIADYQAQLEKMTWQHIMTVRDALPGQTRAAFVRAVQGQWEQAVSHMQHQVAMTGACSLHGPGSMGTGEGKSTQGE